MSSVWTEQRDQALRDLVDLERQVGAGELGEQSAARLRAQYEAQAATALAQLERPAAADSPVAKDQARRRGTTTAYVLAGVAALVAAALLPTSLLDRPKGGFVSGNEVAEGLPAPPARVGPVASADPAVRDLSKVPNSELEAVVAANPGVVGMRLALANRYADEQDFDKALGHYRLALRAEPQNAEALAHLGWTLLQLGLPQEAAQVVARARRLDPRMDDALWFDANIRLYGMQDPTGAARVLVEMRRRPLTPVVREQVDTLLATAQEQLGRRR